MMRRRSAKRAGKGEEMDDEEDEEEEDYEQEEKEDGEEDKDEEEVETEAATTVSQVTGACVFTMCLYVFRLGSSSCLWRSRRSDDVFALTETTCSRWTALVTTIAEIRLVMSSWRMSSSGQMSQTTSCKHGPRRRPALS